MPVNGARILEPHERSGSRKSFFADNACFDHRAVFKSNQQRCHAAIREIAVFDRRPHFVHNLAQSQTHPLEMWSQRLEVVFRQRRQK